MKTNYSAIRAVWKTARLTRDPQKPHGYRGNAIVIFGADGATRLMSYSNVVARIDADGTFHKRWDGWTEITGHHIRMFAREYAPAWLFMFGVGADGKRHGTFKSNWLALPITGD